MKGKRTRLTVFQSTRQASAGSRERLRSRHQIEADQHQHLSLDWYAFWRKHPRLNNLKNFIHSLLFLYSIHICNRISGKFRILLVLI